MEKRKKAYRKVLGEFQHFKRKMVCRASRTELWEACSQIYFYSSVKEYFELNEKIPDAYLSLVMAEPYPVRSMWKHYLQKEGLSCQTWEDIGEILNDMLMEWKLPKAEGIQEGRMICQG